jgi:hypothetical protein
MENALLENFDEYSKKNYIRTASSKDYWFDFSFIKLNKYIREYNDKFNIVIIGDNKKQDDFYIIPYNDIKHLLVEKHFSRDQGNRSPRWIGTITNNMLKISNCGVALDCSQYYGNKNIIDNIGINENDNNDYAIQNKLAEIKVRQKQSRFRKMVLKNFNNKCCISGIKEIDLLRASHIIPWSDNIETRLDPSNGLCLFILYDVLFDQGYFSLSDNYQIIIPNNIGNYSPEIQNILLSIKDKKILNPIKHKIKLEYIKYHRENIFIQKNSA